MTEMAAEYFKMSHDRLQVIMQKESIRAAGLSAVRVREICLGRQWPHDTIHQSWLDEAKPEEIAHWVWFIDKLETESQ